MEKSTSERRDPAVKVDLMDDKEILPKGKIYRRMAEKSRRLSDIPRSAVCGGNGSWKLIAMMDSAFTGFMSSLSVHANRSMVPGYWDYMLNDEGATEETLEAFRRERIEDKDLARAVLYAMQQMHEKSRMLWLSSSTMAMTEAGLEKRLRMMLPFELLGWERAEVFLEIFVPVLDDLTLEGKRGDLISREYARLPIEYLRLNQIKMKGDLLRHLMGLNIWGKTNPTLKQVRDLVDVIWSEVQFAAE